MSRVLLVDDDALLTELLTEYLTAEGLNVHSVPDGEAGVQEILTGQYDVVVLDSMMPKMNGLDVLKNVRTQSTVPIIMLTAKGDDIDRIIGLEWVRTIMYRNHAHRANSWRVSTPSCAVRNTATNKTTRLTAFLSATLSCTLPNAKPASKILRLN